MREAGKRVCTDSHKTKTVEVKNFDCFWCDPAGARTQDPNIKSVVLYLLSYEINAK